MSSLPAPYAEEMKGDEESEVLYFGCELYVMFK
jgi:hypothetical protein